MAAISRLEHLLYHSDQALLIKNIVTFVVLSRLLLRLLKRLYDRGPVGYAREVIASLVARFFRLAKRIPFVRNEIEQRTSKILKDVQEEVAPRRENEPRFIALPPSGLPAEKVHEHLEYYAGLTQGDFLQGRASGTVYHGITELSQLIYTTYQKFSFSNPLHPDIFPGVRKMEAEVVAMVVRMFNGGSEACGTMTSGGTESILMACKAMRDWAYDVKGITEPEMVVPVSAHAAFDKAASYFKIKILHAPVDEKTRKVNVRAVKRMVTSNTIMIVGSAPSFPHGVIDDIEGLAKIALRNKIGLHVDSCLGGFLVPFMDKAGFPLAPFDFRVPGVTSISCDTHKYGFAPKGSSVIMYSNPNFRKYQYFVAPDWPGGIYASPSIAGSRPGALIAGCWTALIFMGENGYVEATKKIVSCAKRIAEALRKIPGIKVYGETEVSVVAFGSDHWSIYKLGHILTKKGWNLNSLQYPPSIHLCCTERTPLVEEQFIKDVAEAAIMVSQDPNNQDEGMGAIYGLAAALPDRSLVDSIARGFIDCLYSA